MVCINLIVSDIPLKEKSINKILQKHALNLNFFGQQMQPTNCYV
jgi:hypothetical protein